jgi:hypothetical protein
MTTLNPNLLSKGMTEAMNAAVPVMRAVNKRLLTPEVLLLTFIRLPLPPAAFATLADARVQVGDTSARPKPGALHHGRPPILISSFSGDGEFRPKWSSCWRKGIARAPTKSGSAPSTR